MPLSYVEVSVDDEEEEDNEQNKRNNENKKKKKEESKENRLLIFSFSKAKKRIVSKIRRKPSSLNMSSSSLPSASSGFWKYVCFCGIETPNTLECSSSSNSDPKDAKFTIEMLRVLVQTNDFFSNDCNPHL